MAPLVELKSAGLSLGRRPIIEDVSFSIEAGETVGVIGPNGSGKTTLLRVVATLIRPTSGDGAVLGRDLLSPRIREVRPEIGLISHHPALLPELTVEENLTHFTNLTGNQSGGIDRALAAVGMSDARSRLVSACSYGMQRRLEVAWLLMAKPKVLLLDEAKSGLDVSAQGLIDALVELTVNRGGAVISVSHDSGQLGGPTFTRILGLEHGRLQVVA